VQNVAVDTQFMRGINASAVLSVLREAGQVSVAELAVRTGLSRQAVTRALGNLEAAGLVSFHAPDATGTRSGRPAQSVAFNPRAGMVLGISLSPDAVRVALADLSGEIIERDERGLDPRGDVSGQVEPAVRALLTRAGLTTSQVWAACAGVPGIVDVDSGEVRLSSSMSSLQGADLVRGLRDLLECEVAIDNDVKLATEGEQWRGAPHVLSSLVLVEWGDRVGAGLLLNGSLYRGASNDSGDLGFLDLGMGEQDAGAGADGLGPFERAVGGAALVESARRHVDALGDGILAAALRARPEIATVIDGVLADSPAALAALAEVAVPFARGVAAIRALLDPQLVVIGGPMARCGDRLLALLGRALSDEVLNQPALELSTLGDDAVVHGAIHHALAMVDGSRLAPGTLSEAMSAPTR
jgi:predicted NBD/HSP70 family sugar kinase